MKRIKKHMQRIYLQSINKGASDFYWSGFSTKPWYSGTSPDMTAL